jgi:pyrroline-5-carboxylate reductase
LVIMKTLVIVGGGRMGEALIGGLIASGHMVAANLLVVEPDAERAATLAASFGVATATGLAACALDASTHDALIAVKPATVAEVCGELAGRVHRVLSIAAGVSTASMEAAFGDHTPVVRSMPNTPALVGVGASAIAAGRHASNDDLDWAGGILGAVGVVARVEEKLLDAVTGLSGSGPAYLFLVAEALVDGAVAQGLPRAVAVTLAHQTIAGAGRLLVESGDQAAVLRANVTSPGGTTAAGLRALESAGVRSAFIEAVAAATRRAHELG